MKVILSIGFPGEGGDDSVAGWDNRETFTAEEFSAVRRRIGEDLTMVEPDYEKSAIDAALRIAANVMRPGVIEDAVVTAYCESDLNDEAEVIRRALTETDNG